MSGANIKIGASSDEFKKQMQEVSRQLKLITSECGLAAQKAKLFGTEQERLATIQKELTGRIQAQTQIIKLYQDRLVNINGEIDREKTKQGELSKKIDEVTKKREEVRAETGRNSEESQKLTKELEKLREAYAKSEDNINSSKNSLVDMTSKMNNAEKKLLEYKKSLEDLNKEIANAKLDKLSENFDRTGEALTNAGQKASIVGAGIIGANIAIGKMALDTESDLQTLSGRLGLTSEEAESLKQVAKDLYNNGFGESLGDCVNDIVILQQNIKETSNMTNEQKLALLEQISTIKTLFGAESTEITRTLNNMINNGVVENFQEGLDIITTGFQEGLNSGGDLLDVLYEYSPQFKKLGLNGQSALSYIKTGLEAGGYNADKMADALKELSIRAIDGSKTTAQGFELIGLNADETARKFAAGGDSAKDALDVTIEGLKNIQDPIEQDLAGVNLFGTMWEDSSKQAILAMNGMSEGLQDVSGATEKAGQEINNSFNKELASTIRESKDAMLPLGQEILNLAKVALPMLKPLIEALSNFLAGLSDNSKKAIAVVAGIATVIGPTLIVLGSFSKGISNIIDGYKKVKDVGSGAIEIVGKFGGKALEVAKSVGSLSSNLAKSALEFGKSAVQAGISAAKFTAHKVATVASTVATNVMAAAQAALNFVMSLNPITWIIIGIVALIGFIVLLWNKCEWFRNLCYALFDGLKAAWNATVEFFKAIFEAFTIAFKIIWEAVMLYFKIKIEAWKLVFEIVVNAIKAIWEVACNVVKTVWNTAVELIKASWEGFKVIFETVGNFIKSAWEGITNGISSVWNNVVNGIKNAWNGIISPFQSVIDKIISIWSNIKSMFKLPHFNISGKFSLSPPSIPKVSVDWYYKGGIFKTPTILGGIGVGDAFNGQGSNAEAIVPLDDMYRNIKAIFDNRESKYLTAEITVINNIDGKAMKRENYKETVRLFNRSSNNYKKIKGDR